jgi:hypothetical protein
MQAEKLSMKEQLLEMVVQIQEQEIDLQKTPALFKWRYDENPHIEFQLLVKEVDSAFEGIDETVMH